MAEETSKGKRTTRASTRKTSGRSSSSSKSSTTKRKSTARKSTTAKKSSTSKKSTSGRKTTKKPAAEPAAVAAPSTEQERLDFAEEEEPREEVAEPAPSGDEAPPRSSSFNPDADEGPSDQDAMGLDKRRAVVGKQYGASRGTIFARFAIFFAVVAALAVGAKFAVDELDAPPETNPAEAPWADPNAPQRAPLDPDLLTRRGSEEESVSGTGRSNP